MVNPLWRRSKISQNQPTIWTFYHCSSLFKYCDIVIKHCYKTFSMFSLSMFGPLMFSLSMFGPVRSSVCRHSVFRRSVPFDVQSFDVQSHSKFGLSMFGPLRCSVFRGLVFRRSVFRGSVFRGSVFRDSVTVSFSNVVSKSHPMYVLVLCTVARLGIICSMIWIWKMYGVQQIRLVTDVKKFKPIVLLNG